MHPLLDALDTARAAGLWHGGEVVLVATSGGPDSTALLHALVTRAEALGLAGVVAGHVDHGLRADSGRDAEAVRALCRRLGVEAYVERVRVSGPGGVQAAARRARYAALERMRRAAGAAVVATAHTATDQAETVLMRLARGSAPSGLAGIPAKRGRVVRPLLGVRREVLGAWCEAHGLPVRRDPSNDSDAFVRPRVRHEILPAIEGRLNPAAVEAIGRLAAQVRDDEAVLRPLADALAGAARAESGGLEVGALSGAPRALVRRVLAAAWREAAAGPLDPVDHAHLERLCDLVDDPRPGRRRLTLPGGVLAERSMGRLVLAANGAFPRLDPVRLEGAGSYPLPAAGVTVDLEQVDDAAAIAPSPSRAVLAGEAPLPLLVRGPRPGDRLRGGRRVARVLADARVPHPLRGRVPVLVGPGDGAVLWVLGMTSGPRVSAARGPAWRLEVRPLEEGCREGGRDSGGFGLKHA